MAKIGLKKLYYAVLAEDDATNGCTYGVKKEIVAPIESKISLENAEGELYGGDQLVESSSEFVKGTLTLGVTDDDDTIFAELLGNATTEKTLGATQTKYNEVIQKSTDIGPYVGIGQIVPKIVNGVKKWKAEFLCKTRFKPYGSESKTKGKSLEYSTPSVEATIFATAKNEYEHHATFDKESDAESYLTYCFGPAVTSNSDTTK